MIRHIVFFTAKKKANIDQIVEGLSVLTAIPHARRIEIARNCKTDQLGNDVDVVVYGEFDNEGNQSSGCNRFANCGSRLIIVYPRIGILAE